MGDVRKMCSVCLKFVQKCEKGRGNLGTVCKKQDTCYCSNNTPTGHVLLFQ
jgi:hypothetical protein